MNDGIPTAAERERIEQLHAALGIGGDYAVRRAHPFQPEADATMLTEVRTGLRDPARAILLERAAAEAWRRLREGAEGDRVQLELISGFRSVERQAEIVRGKLLQGQAIEDILRVVAAPGYSEHHTGCAVDLGTPESAPLEESFEQTAAFAWLARRAGDFGFTLTYPRDNPLGIVYEPWHWRWRA